MKHYYTEQTPNPDYNCYVVQPDLLADYVGLNLWSQSLNSSPIGPRIFHANDLI